MSEVRREYGAEMDMDSEEEADVEGVIAKEEENLADFMNGENQGSFEEIFDAARRSYSDPTVRKEWDQLFINLNSELLAADGEDEVESIVAHYIKKANALI